MGFPYRTILCPIDFDENSLNALETATRFARQNDGLVVALHVVPLIIPPTGMPVYVDMYKGQEDAARKKLDEIARTHLAGVKYELLTDMGDPAGIILKAERKTGADLVVMATHGRRGFSRFFLGSVAELVVRESTCPVLMVRNLPAQKHLVGSWMTVDPVTASPDDKLSIVHDRMLEGGFRCVPVVKDGKPIGIITDRDIRTHTGAWEHTEAFKAMSEHLVTVSPSTSIHEAARLLRERKIGALPVIENGQLAGVITTSDVLNALTAED